MKTPRFAVAALLSALAAAPALADTPATPLSPAAPLWMDPVSEGTLVGLGQMAVPTLGVPAPRSSAADKKAPLIAMLPDDAQALDSKTDLAGIGQQIINPAGALAPTAPIRGLTSMANAAPHEATFDTHVDANISAAPVAKATSLSFVRTAKLEAAIGDKSTVAGALNGDAETPASDPKLHAGDASFAPGSGVAQPR